MVIVDHKVKEVIMGMGSQREETIKELENQCTGWVIHRHPERGKEGTVEKCSQKWKSATNERKWTTRKAGGLLV